MADDYPTAPLSQPTNAAGWEGVEYLSRTRHDLRTPLNAVLGYSEMLLEDIEDLGDAALTEQITAIRAQGAVLLASIDAGLKPSALDAAGLPATPEGLVQHVRREFTAAAANLAASADALAEAAAGSMSDESLADFKRIRTASHLLAGLVARDAPSVPFAPQQPAPAPAPVAPPPAQRSTITANWSRAGMLLVVDDVELNRDVLSRHLERQGHLVVAVSSGQEALELLESGRFDLVLLDVMMPEMDGFEVLRRIKENERLRQIRVVMLSALGETDSVARCIELGADDYLAKPFDPVLLKARIGASLDRKRAREREIEQQERLAEAREAEHRRKTAELEFARTVQCSLLPRNDVTLERVEIVGRMVTATEVGGDYYDFLALDSGRYLLALGDATGHGVAAGLIVGMTKMGLLSRLDELDAHGELHRLVGDLNTSLKRCTTQRGIGMALALVVFDPETLEVSLTSNGIPPPCHYSAVTGTLTPLDLKAPPLGFIRDLPVPIERRQLAPGDSLVLLSDGFAERFDAEKREWGYETVERELERICRAETSADAIARELVEACDRFAGGCEPHDDITIVVVTVR
jgi:sigma-B regulation protein RsbU (phosphoserine phosphatase)